MNFVKPVVLEILHALWISVWNESVILEQRRVHERWRGIFIFLSSSPANKQLTLRATTYQSVVPLFLLFSCISGIDGALGNLPQSLRMTMCKKGKLSVCSKDWEGWVDGRGWN